jgi:hypothetical protein
MIETATPGPASRLAASLGFAQLEPREPELQLLHRWLDTWTSSVSTTDPARRAMWDK